MTVPERITFDGPATCTDPRHYGDLDEILLHGVTVHLERMGDGEFWLCLRRDTDELHVWIRSATGRALLHTHPSLIDGPTVTGLVREGLGRAGLRWSGDGRVEVAE